MKPILFTKEGYEKIQKEKEALILARKDAVLDLKKARDMGDLSENGYYKASKSKLVSIDRRLRELTMLIRFGKVPTVQKDIVGVSSKLSLENRKEKRTYTIVGSYEANPAEGKISLESPIGKLLVGKRSGDEITHNGLLFKITII